MVSLLSFACATGGPPPASSSKETPAETVAQITQLLDGAEEQLKALDVEKAGAALDESQIKLKSPELAGHPDAPRLQKRHDEIGARLPDAIKIVEKNKLIGIKGDIETQRGALKEAMTAALDKKAAAAAFDNAREASGKLKETLAQGKKYEAGDADYKTLAGEVRAEQEKSDAELEAKWLEVGVTIQKAAIEDAAKQATAAVKPTTNASAKEEDFQKADAALKAFADALEKGAALEAKDPKYAQAVGPKRAQLESMKKAVEDTRQKASVRLATEATAKAKANLEATLNTLKTKTDEANFDAAKAALEALEQALVAGKALEGKDPNYVRIATGSRILAERYPKEIAGHRERQKLDQQKASVETARTAAKASVSTLTAATPADGFSNAEKSVGDLEKALDAGKGYVATDKTYAAFAATVAKEVEGHKASIAKLRQQAAIGAERTQIDAIATNLDVRMTNLDVAGGSLDEAEQAIADLEKAIKGGATLAATDKTYAAQLATMEKKLAAQKAKVDKKKAEQGIAAHRTEVESQKAKVDALLLGLKGQLEHAQYQKAEDAISELQKTLTAGEPLGAQDAKYAKELKTVADSLPQKRIEMRKMRIEAASNVVAEKMKALEGTPAPTAFDEASAAVRELGLVVDAAKTLTTTDKTYLALVANAEKQVAAQQASIDKRKVGLGVEKHKASVEAALAMLAERMKALTGEPEDVAFSDAERAVSELNSALDGADDVTAAEKTHAAYLAASKKKGTDATATITKRKGEVTIARHKKALAAAQVAVTERMKGLDGAPEAAAFTAAEEAIGAFEKVIEGGVDAAELDAKYKAELAAAKAKVAPFRATIERRKSEVAVAAHKTFVETALAAANARIGNGKLDAAAIPEAENAVAALGTAIEEGAPLAEKDPKHAAYLAGLGKKLESFKATITRNKTEQAVAAHRAQVDVAKAKLETTIAGLKGQLDHHAYQDGENVVSELSKILQAGQSLAEDDPKYGKELTALEATLPAKRMAMRKLRVEAQTAEVSAKMKALEGTPAPAAFDEAEAAVRDLGLVAESARGLNSTDKTYLAMVASTEKAVETNKAAIEKRKIGLGVQKHRATVEAAAAALTERMKALAGEPDDAAFKAADTAAKDLEHAVETVDGTTESDKAYAGYLAVQKKKAGDALLQIQKRKGEVAVSTHRKELLAAQAAVAERMKALAGATDDAAFSGAEAAVGELEKTIADASDEVSTDPKYGKELEAAKAKIPGHKSTIERRKSEVAVAAHKAKVEAAAAAVTERLGKNNKVEADGADEAQKAVDALEAAVNEGESLGAADKKHAAYLAVISKKVEAGKAAIARSKSEQAVAAHRAQVEIAKQKLDATIEGLKGNLDFKAFQAAEGVVADLSKAVQSGESLAEADAKYGKELAAIEASIPAKRMALRKIRIEAQAADVGAKLKALQGAPAAAAFEEAEAAVRDQSLAVEAGKSYSGGDKAYIAMIAGAEKQVAANQAAIEKRKVGLQVDKHKATVEAALAALDERVKALAGEPVAGDFDAALSAVNEVKGACDSAEGTAQEDKAHQAYLASVKKKADEAAGKIGRRKAEVAVLSHKKELQIAQAAVAEWLKALAGEPAESSFSAAEGAIANLEKAVASGDEAAAADPKYKKELAAVAAKIPGMKAQLEKKKGEVAIAAQKKEADEAEEMVKAKLAGMSDDASVTEAEKAVEAYESALSEGEGLPTKDKKQLAVFTAGKKKVEGFRSQIEKQRFSKQVAAQAAELEAAEKDVQIKLAGLEGKLEHALYQGAENAVSKLKGVIDGGEELASKSGEHKKRLAAAKGRIEDYRVAIRKNRIEATRGIVDERMKTLEGKPEDADFAAAEGAVRDLAQTVEAGRQLATTSKEFPKFLGAQEKLLEGLQQKIDHRRGSAAVEAHQGELAAAEKGVADALGALTKKPSAADFDTAEKSIGALESAIDSGNVAAEKEPKYKARLAALTKKIPEFRATIEKRRFDAEVSGQREKTELAAAKVTTTMENLNGKPDPSAFGLAEEAIGELESVLGEGKTFAESNAAYKKELAGEEKKVAGYKARIVKKKAEAELLEHTAKLAEAVEAVDTSLAALAKEPNDSTFGGVESSVEALEGEIAEASAVGKGDKKHGKAIADAKKRIPKGKAAIASAKVELEVKKQKEDVEGAAAETEKRIAALEESTQAPTIKAAESSLEKLGEALEAGKALAKKNKKHAVFLASYQKKMGAYRSTIGRRAVQGEVRAHQAKVEEAEGEVKERLNAAKGQTEFSLYQAVESAISSLKKTIDDGAELGSKDEDYGKSLDKRAAGLDAYRVTMRTHWIEAADGDAAAKLKVLDGEPTASDFSAAEAAVRDLENTTESGKRLKVKDGDYKALLAATDKRVGKYKATIAKRRASKEFGGVQKELEVASVEASTRMQALNGASSSDEISAASESLDALERSIEDNAPAAEKDPAHKKKVAALTKKVKADRAKLAKYQKAAGDKPAMERLASTETALTESLAALGPGAEESAFDAAEEAVSALDAAVSDLKSDAPKDLKKRLAKDQKKILAARATIEKKKGGAAAGSQKAEIEAATMAAKEAFSGLGKKPDADQISKAETALDSLNVAIDGAKDEAVKNKKLAKYVAIAQKTAKKLKGDLKAKSKAARTSEPEEAVAEAPEPVDDFPARLAAAHKTAKMTLKALKAHPKDDVALTSARAAIDELESVVEEASNKPAKALAKKVTAAKKTIKIGKKMTVRKEPKEPKEPAVASNEGGGDDPQKQVAAAWSSFSKQMKAIKKKKPTIDAIDSALQAASDVEAALEEGSQSSGGKSAKYKKYAGGIKKKLKKAKAKLNKQRRTAGTSVG